MNKCLVAIIVLALLAVGIYLSMHNTQLRGEPVQTLLAPIIDGKDPDQALAARALRDNYLETRSIAALWSGLYWGFAWISAILGALAGLILKFESIIKDEKVKKDVAAFLAVTAALLVTISTSGDFQRKWQANRMAAADLERDAYEFLKNNGAMPRSYLGKVGETLHKRHISILGGGEAKKPQPEKVLESLK